MNKQKMFVVTLLITIFLINLIFGAVAINMGTTTVDSLKVVKGVNKIYGAKK